MAQEVVLSVSELKKILSHSEIGIWEWNLNTNIQVWSDRMYELLGFHPNQKKASSEIFFNLLHPDDKVKINDLITDEILSMRQFKTQIRVHTNNNLYRYFEYSAFPKRSGGEAISIYGSIRDIHESVLLTKEISKSEKLLKKAGEMAASGTWELDLTTSIPLWSPQVYRIHELGEEGALDLKQAVLFFRPWARVVIQNYIERAAATGLGWDLELPIRTAKGRDLWIRTIGESEKEDGKPVRLFGVVKELTEHQQLEDKLRLIFHHSTDAHFIFDKNGIIDCNEKSVSMLRCNSKTELMAIHPAEFSPEFQPDGKRSIDKAKEMDSIAYTKGNHKFEWIHKRTDGEEFPVEVTLKSVPYGNKQVLLAVWHEITSEKRAEQLIIRHETMLSETQQLTHCGSWERDFVSRQSYISNEAFRIFGLGLSSEDMSHRMFLRMIHPDDRRQLLMTVRSVIDQKISSRINIRIIRPDGVITFILVIIKPVVAQSGKVTKIFGAVMDIDDQIRSENELILSKEQAESAAVAKSEFLYTMSHEIRTPLNAVIGFTKLLMEQNPRPDQLDYLNILRCSSAHLLALVNDIMDFSKIEAGEINFEETGFNIGQLVNDIISGNTQHAGRRGNTLESITEIAPYATVLGDPMRLSQVLNNLVSNAIKFTESGKIQVFARIVGREIAYQTIEFRVEDTGIGIATEKQELIFDRFTQAHSDTTRRYSGSGLGLSIVKRLLQLQGSDINVQSEQGKGSVFYFSLRFKNAEEKILSSRNAAPMTISSLKGMKVLIAEDNEINVLLMSKLMQKWDVQFDIARNGLMAFELAQMKDYDLILMDLQMPEMDGYEATAKLRELPEKKFRDIPIIAVTASIILDNLDTVRAGGMNDFIAKPIDPSSLYEKISSYFRKL